MILAQSRTTRRFIGRMDCGSDFHDSLRKICRQHEIKCGEIRAVGSFSAVQLQEYDPDKKDHKSPQRLKFHYSVLSLSGNISLDKDELSFNTSVVLGWQERGETRVLGGELVKGQVFSLEFVVEAFDDILLWREKDAVTGLSLWGRIDKRDMGGIETPEPAIEISSQTEEEPVATDTAEEYELSIGDYLEHPRLGRCEIVQIDGDERVHIKLENGRIVVLSLVVCTLQRTEHESDRQVFKVRIKQRR